jgi:hypothetical protein
MRWEGHACSKHGDMRNTNKMLGILNGRDCFADKCVFWKIILKWSLKKKDMSVWTGFKWLRIGSKGGLL